MGTDGNRENMSGWPVCGLRFEVMNSWTHSRCANHLTAEFQELVTITDTSHSACFQMFKIKYIPSHCYRGWNILVSIATRYGLGRRGIESRWWPTFSTPLQ